MITLSLLLACGEAQKPAEKPAAPITPAAPAAPPEPVQQALSAPAAPALLLTQAWFWKDAQGNPKPGWARLDIWRQGPTGWSATRVEDKDSNVFHKAILWNGGVLTIAGEKAMLKHWTFADGKWSSTTIFEKNWGGKFNRLRDLEIGDVDGDGKEELVIATHDSGVILVIKPGENGAPPTVVELDQKADTFVHEIEIGDVDGDGKDEFFATPSDRNKADASQAGAVVMYKWDGTTYVRSYVDNQPGTHAKEILAKDLDGDGKAELFSVQEAEIDPATKTIKKPVEIRQYFLKKDGTFEPKVIATIDDKQTRFLVPGDFDGDGQTELVAAAIKKGLFILEPGAKPGEPWTATNFATNSAGFEHACVAADLDGNGQLELYVAADDQKELKKYTWNAASKTFDAELLGKFEGDLTWNITPGSI